MRSAVTGSDVEAGSASLWTRDDVARVLSVRPEYVYRLVRQGLPCHRLGKKGYLRFRPHDVLTWLERGGR